MATLGKDDILGWVKVAVRMRLIKKQEVVDEEKRSRIQETRNNGQRGDSRGKHDIPFGVRAIQSGIQVDGIWISNSNTPVPSEITLSSLPAESSDDLAKYSPNLSGREFLAQPRPRPNVRVRSLGRMDILAYRTHNDKLHEIVEGKATRTSYKPRRSSQLRYGGQGDFDEATLDRLEGTPLPLRKKISGPRSRTYYSNEPDPDSSAADNERNSGTSDESDATLSHDPPISTVDQCLTPPNTKSTYISERARMSDPLPIIKSSPGFLQSSISDEITSMGDTFNDMYSYLMNSETLNDKNQASINSETRNEENHSSHFLSGELHVNKTTRKVNTGFEVLPAGTFGAPAEFKAQIQGSKTTDPVNNKKPPVKLQKKQPPTNSESVSKAVEGS